jgi:hypothetical protein
MQRKMRQKMSLAVYENDFYGWIIEQTGLLKLGRYNDLDTANLIEEMESMGKSEKRALESRLVVLLQHLLKWQHQPSFRGKSWELTIKEQRLRIEKIMRDNPSLKRQLESCFFDAYQFAVIQAAKETGIDEKTFPGRCEWNLQQVLDPTFFSA